MRCNNFKKKYYWHKKTANPSNSRYKTHIPDVGYKAVAYLCIKTEKFTISLRFFKILRLNWHTPVRTHTYRVFCGVKILYRYGQTNTKNRKIPLFIVTFIQYKNRKKIHKTVQYSYLVRKEIGIKQLYFIDYCAHTQIHTMFRRLHRHALTLHRF